MKNGDVFAIVAMFMQSMWSSLKMIQNLTRCMLVLTVTLMSKPTCSRSMIMNSQLPQWSAKVLRLNSTYLKKQCSPSHIGTWNLMQLIILPVIDPCFPQYNTNIALELHRLVNTIATFLMLEQFMFNFPTVKFKPCPKFYILQLYARTFFRLDSLQMAIIALNSKWRLLYPQHVHLLVHSLCTSEGLSWLI